MSIFEKKNQFVSAVDECLGNAVKQGIFHLNTTSEPFDGRYISLNDHQRVLNFGSCSYLGLELDERLKQGAIDAVLKYGAQFSSSRAFLSCGLYLELEALFSEMFGAHCIVSATTTLAHLSAIPVLVSDNDAVILDHQVHGSVQNATQLLKPRGVRVEMIRHNDLDALEEKIKELRTKHYRIWYMADGVYSMYGDFTPIKKLYALMDKYPQLHVYIDDAHGMSWTGTHGTGYITSQVALRPQVYLITSLAKAFGSGGGVLVFQDREDMRKVRTGGSSFVFSGPLQPAILGASIASARIHLSPEIYKLQDELKEKLNYCDRLIIEKKLPYVFSSGSPIFYIGLGIPAMGYTMVKKLIQEGFYVDIGIFPGVPLKRTGLRLAINTHMSTDDIRHVLEAIERCYPQALAEEQQSIREIGKHFRMDFSYAQHLDKAPDTKEQPLQIKHYRSIRDINKDTWNALLGNRGNFDWDGCCFLEDVFHGHSEPENNWNFHYYLILDKEKPVLATFVTELLHKDDMLSPESVSQQIEEERRHDPYYMTSKVMMMGSLLTEGEHLFLDRSSAHWKTAMDLFIRQVQDQQELCGASTIYLRDLAAGDEELKSYLTDKGFLKQDMPDSWIIDDLSWDTAEDMLNRLSYRSRKHVRQHVLKHADKYTVKINEGTVQEIGQWQQLYKQVKQKSLKLNTFELPDTIFEACLSNPSWEIVELYFNEPEQEPLLAAVVFVYLNGSNYCPVFLGINYDLNAGYSVYRQALYQLILRAKQLGCKKIHLGMEASEEKRKFSAGQKRHSVFIQSNENYALSKLNDYSNQLKFTK